MKTAKKYLGLYFALFRASFIADLEYRANFISRIVTDIFWYGAQILTFEILFQHMTTIGTWNIQQTRVFLGILFIVDAFYMVMLSENLDRLSDRVRKGELDLLLAKPVSSQFMVSLQRSNTAIFGNMAMAIAWLIFSLAGLPDFSWARLLWLVLLIPSGLIILYFVRFSMAAMSVIFTRAENIQYVWYQLYKFGTRPDSIYAPWLRLTLMTVLPVSFIGSVPSRFLLEPPDFALLAWALILPVIMLYASKRFWNWCLTHYTSASS